MTARTTARRMLADAKNLDARAALTRGQEAAELRQRARNLRDAAARLTARDTEKNSGDLFG